MKKEHKPINEEEVTDDDSISSFMIGLGLSIWIAMMIVAILNYYVL